MKLGLGSYAFGWAVGVRGHAPARPLDEIGLLEKAAALGVGLLQIGDHVPLARFDPARLARLDAAARHGGIALEVGARRLTAENLAAHLRVAQRLGAKTLRFVVDDEDYQPSPDEIAAILREGVPQLEAAGVTLGVENHDRLGARVLARIVRQVDSRRVGICLDTANSLGAGEGIAEVLAYLASWTVNLHLKDFAVERLPHLMGFTVMGRPAGGGILDIPAILAALQPFGRCKSALLELWTPPAQTLEETIEREAAWAAQSVAYLAPLFVETVPARDVSQPQTNPNKESGRHPSFHPPHEQTHHTPAS